ncbi:MAG TPA: hypothetical protein DEF43_00495 [Chloroflexus aurantiacus]|jgi:hypothetical protein|uniref:Uncharacterized protein n=1 Tax=Chloroflexus aurantiacus (strain ATCC 29366 / DSM 635 / J-10-fl) TaxID=324602 RepID=A9WB96_CHLAA|nr:hypothetical protein [Chloroflexus aurantiacus]ABY36889.1 hypothetical protein Caur_3711 [Chloroflexus aurantiacus J-10-fl]HBW65654.1 hypothetical protein [Chloroflexus aurantiacus]
MDEKTLIYFLQYFAGLLYERALESKERCTAAQKRPDKPSSRDFACGHAQAYYEVLSTFVHQAEVFGIPADQLGIPNIDPDELLR